ncbi:polyamine aminopropyltransferase [Natronincola ferrireducens]|uniref:Polyamine aminopropyltransferase n=1 Tax=Natronincola ferrireducens TaxID=393762 RepID=A0A1G8YKS7_9FIRM|nr:polyamine aminopropyltransferase [Natronincola ferrireducens]SDK03469.1 spermidine synthase [Natronincola ferrireducens]
MPFILSEYHSPGLSVNWTANKVLFHKQSDFQEVAIVELEEMGRALVLDGYVQVTVEDEFVYNEMITHVPLFTHPKPEKVLIIGGGDGGSAREAAKHPSVTQVDLCEIDPMVIEACREHLPEMSVSYNHPKVNVITKDGVKFIKDHPNTYDVIIIDSSDPIGPAVDLFGKDFYSNVHKALKEDGIFACQSESLFYHQDLIKDVHEMLKGLFPIARLYTATTPTYPGFLWAYSMGSKKYDPFDRMDVKKPEIEARYYNHDIYKGCFALPTFIKETLGLKK